MSHHKTHIVLSKKALTYFLSGLFLFVAALTLWARSVDAEHISYDPYADSVKATAAAVVDANNAVGAPNGTHASLAGIGSSLTLDMGSGEEGTRTLRLYLGQINAQANIVVAFLDSNNSVIASQTRQLGVDLNPSVQNFSYNWTNYNKAYRYVRVSSALGGGVNVDAVEALGYIGSTPAQDTDGDGRADRFEQHNGTNPLVRDAQPDGGTTTPVNPPGSNDTSNGDSDGSEQVNNPPKADQDKDNDGIDDDWEDKYGLDPKDKNDGQADPDKDGLSNLVEYRLGSNPNKLDTDGDGMPDGWEYDNGLDVNKNDADADLDGDYLTNLGEYRNGTDPNKADDLAQVFGKDCNDNQPSPWDWFLIFLLLLGAGVAWWLAGTTNRKSKSTLKLG